MNSHEENGIIRQEREPVAHKKRGGGGEKKRLGSLTKVSQLHDIGNLLN